MTHRQQSTHFITAFIDLRRGIFAVLILSAALTRMYGQGLKTGKHEQVSLPPKALPSAIQSQVQALGSRLRITGKEETVLDAQFADDTGREKAIHIVHQISGLVRIEGLHQKAVVTFDGDFTHGVGDRTDDALLDTFVLDTVEGMFDSLQKGASMILLGHEFQLDSSAASESQGPHYDIYVVTAPDRIRRTNIPQPRRFSFDSKTGLLSNTRYFDAAGVNIETRFSNWKYIDGSAYPTTVERYENGRFTFAIIVTSLAGRMPHAIESFQKGVDSLD
jgi:hypothetical protein